MENAQDAEVCVRELTGVDIDGRQIRVEISSGVRRAPGGRDDRRDGGGRDYGRDRGYGSRDGGRDSGRGYRDDRGGRDYGRDGGRDRDYGRDRNGSRDFGRDGGRDGGRRDRLALIFKKFNMFSLDARKYFHYFICILFSV